VKKFNQVRVNGRSNYDSLMTLLRVEPCQVIESFRVKGGFEINTAETDYMCKDEIYCSGNHLSLSSESPEYLLMKW